MSTMTWKVSHPVKESQLFFFWDREFFCISSYKVSSFVTSCCTSLQPRPVSGTKHQWRLDKIYTWRENIFHEQALKHWLLSKHLPEHWLQQETKAIRSNLQLQTDKLKLVALTLTQQTTLVKAQWTEEKQKRKKSYFNFLLECKTWRFCFHQKHQRMRRQGGPTYKNNM